jgi:hypothetical protein
MDHLALKNGVVASATVWRDAEGFRVSIEIRGPDGEGPEGSTHRVPGSDTGDVRKLIAREVGRRGFDVGDCGVWWELKELIPPAADTAAA